MILFGSSQFDAGLVAAGILGLARAFQFAISAELALARGKPVRYK